jgi:hypothetical protein
MNAEIEFNMTEAFSDFVMRYYINSDGKYLGGWDENPPEGSIAVYPPPTIADQIWMFSDVEPFWSESPSQARTREGQWRDEQMARIANQLLMIEDEDPDAEPGTKRQWMDYRIALRKWVDGGSVDFPDATKRPVAPE